MCLSSELPIVRYEGSNVFLNEITVESRQGLPPAAKLKRSAKNKNAQDGVFRKERSIFKTYQEDDDDFVARMMKADLKYSKLPRFLDRTERSNSENCMDLIQSNYKALKDIFQFYVANSKSYPRMNVQDF